VDGSVDPIRDKEIIDTEHLSLSIAMIHNMLFSGLKLFEHNMEAIAAVALTNRGYESIRKEYDKKEADRASHAQKGDKTVGDTTSDEQ